MHRCRSCDPSPRLPPRRHRPGPPGSARGSDLAPRSVYVTATTVRPRTTDRPTGRIIHPLGEKSSDLENLRVFERLAAGKACGERWDTRIFWGRGAAPRPWGAPGPRPAPTPPLSRAIHRGTWRGVQELAGPPSRAHFSRLRGRLAPHNPVRSLFVEDSKAPGTRCAPAVSFGADPALVDPFVHERLRHAPSNRRLGNRHRHGRIKYPSADSEASISSPSRRADSACTCATGLVR